MIEIFSYSFMVRAFLSGVFIASVAPLIGTFLVVRRYSLISDTLAHIALLGVAFGVIFGSSPLLWSLIVTFCAAILIEYLRSLGKISGDGTLALLLSGSLALSTILISLRPSSGVNLMNYFLGSILSISYIEFIGMFLFSAFLLCSIFFLYYELTLASYDEEFAEVSGVRVREIHMIMLGLSSIVVAFSVRIVGALLVGSLMIIPVLSALQFRVSFFRTMILGSLLSLLGFVAGFFISFYADLPMSGTVALLSICIFGISALLNKG